MKNIRFRAWCRNAKCIKKVISMFFDDFGNISSVLLDECEDIEDTEDVEIMQYTGLKDKNGKEIYEGDIFRDSLGYMAVVEWDNDNGRFLGFTFGNERKIIYVGKEPKVEVIGNIHENPALLK
ncbi:MAG: hypothetical protein AWM53_02015 [Candidatus Dichloromethanomonas elyunquensis]|nr:MAG: hypothetical protein AWM53_02015 [Candidatus Dichloromethanomonas elyunquensis]